MNNIDAVISWVDGSEEEYQKKIKKHLPTFANYKKQYLQVNEIEYCVKSIIRFAPFIRKILIVTDNQTPSFNGIEELILSKKVRIVDHKEIFKGYEEHLPTFNPRSIDALLYRIDGLAERFVYFNDDMFLINEIKEEDWFINNKAVLIGRWTNSYRINPIKVLSGNFKKLFSLRPSFNAAQSMSANISGFKKKYFKSFHTARPQVKSQIRNYYNKNPEVLKKQISYKFRNSNQYMPYSLCWHLLIKDKQAEIKTEKEFMEIKKARRLNGYQIESILKKLDKSKEIKYLNIQDLNYAEKNVFTAFDSWMRKRLEI